MTAPEEIQQEIEQTRERLGQTVEELTAKAVRRDWPLALVAAGILVIGAGLVRRRRET
jgi:hypothetical protein